MNNIVIKHSLVAKSDISIGWDRYCPVKRVLPRALCLRVAQLYNSPMENAGHWFERQFNNELTSIYKEASTLDASFDESVHEIRKACKRLRALFRLGVKDLGRKMEGKEERSFKNIGKKLAGARDEHVQTQLCLDLFQNGLQRMPNEDEEMKILEWAQTCFGGKEMNAQDLERWVQKRIYKEALHARALPLEKVKLVNFYKALKRQEDLMDKLAKKAIKSREAELMHRLRKETKIFYYQYEKLSTLDSKRFDPKKGAKFKTVADLLGDIHDLDVFALSCVEYEGELPKKNDLLVYALDRRFDLVEKVKEAW